MNKPKLDEDRPVWIKVGGVGLYLHAPSGNYYARYRLHGRQKWQSLKTSLLTAARLKLREFMVGIERARASAVPDGALETLGDCTRHLREQLTHSQQSALTKTNYNDQLDALAKFWPQGSYEKTRPAAVTHEIVVRLRTALVSARWKVHNTRTTKSGYSAAYTNQVLARLKNVLEIARLKGLCTSDPFAQVSGLQGSIWLSIHSRKPKLPAKVDMDRLFAEMARIVPGPKEKPAFTKWRQDRAIEASEHARFLAYSGMRLEEANRMIWEEVKEHNLRVQGLKINKAGRPELQVKTESSDRLVPIVPAMRTLLAEIRKRRPGPGRILVPHTSLNAIRAACMRLELPRLKHHDLRHYFATVCIEAGTPIPTVSAWLGHSDGGVLAQRVYGHLRQEHSIAAAAKVNFGETPISNLAAALNGTPSN